MPDNEEKPKKKQNQPRHHAAKSKVACALRRKKILKGLMEGKTQKQAGIEAGLSPKTADKQVSVYCTPGVRQIRLGQSDRGYGF